MATVGNQSRAITRFASVSPRKTRLVIDQVRGLQADEAIAVLKFLPNKPAEVVSKTIASAAANAEENLGLSRDDLYVTEIRPMKVRAASGDASERAGASSRLRARRRTLPSC
jgi:ribosomal protein L22